MPENVICAAYLRYSTHSQREASLDDQLRKCREAALSKNWTILDEYIYVDKARTGTDSNMRLAFKEMMRVAMNPNCPFQRIIVDDTSRIARNTREALDVFSILSFYGIHVYYVAQNIDSAHETAEEMITINSLIDSLFSRNLAKETHRGIEGQVLKGYSGGGKRYGYRSEPVYNGKVDIYGNPEADGYVLKINPEEADTVIRIFSLFGEQGYSAKKIVTILNQELIETGSPKPPRKRYWSTGTLLGNKKSFNGILNNEIYIGKYYWNRLATKRNPENGRKHAIIKASDKWIFLNKPDLQIVSQELWEKVKKRQRQARKDAGGKFYRAKLTYSRNLASGLTICSVCDGNVVIVTGGKYAKYGCSNNWNKGSAVCIADNKIDKDVLEQAIVDSLQLNFTYDDVSYLATKGESLLQITTSDRKHRLKEDVLANQLKQIEKEINNFIKAIKAGIVTDVVKKNLLESEQRKRKIENLISKKNDTSSDSIHITKDMVKVYLQDLQLTLNLNPVLGKAFLSILLDKVTIQPDKISWKINSVYKKNYGAVNAIKAAPIQTCIII